MAKLVMPGLGPGIHVLASLTRSKDVDGRDKPGHDEGEEIIFSGWLHFRSGSEGCTEPSSSVALVSFCHQLVGYELSPIGLGQTLAHG